MKLTEAQIRQVIESSIEANRVSQVHRLTELQFRKSIRNHLKSGRSIDEGLMDFLGDMLGGLMDSIKAGFKASFGAAKETINKTWGSTQGEISAKVGGNFPAFNELKPDANVNDKLAMMIYVADMAEEFQNASANFDEAEGVENPYGEDGAEESAAALEKAGQGIGKIGALLDAVSQYVPEAATVQANLDNANESGDPAELMKAVAEANDYIASTLIPQFQEIADLASDAPPALAAEVEARTSKLSNLSDSAKEMKARQDKMFASWEIAKQKEAEMAVDEDAWLVSAMGRAPVEKADPDHKQKSKWAEPIPDHEVRGNIVGMMSMESEFPSIADDHDTFEDRIIEDIEAAETIEDFVESFKTLVMDYIEAWVYDPEGTGIWVKQLQEAITEEDLEMFLAFISSGERITAETHEEFIEKFESMPEPEGEEAEEEEGEEEEGEEEEGMGAVAFGDDAEEEEPKKEESVFRFKGGQLILTENQLKRLVRRLIMN